MSSDPSLFNLVAANYGDMLFSSGMDVLNILIGQIERTILANEVRPHIYLGMQSFSSFELLASHYSELAQKCEKITVFGTADKQPRQVPNTQFIAIPEKASLAYERFIIVNHPSWQVMLLAQESMETRDRWERQRVFNGILTFNPLVVERCQQIAAMFSGNQRAQIGRAEVLNNQQHIAQFVTQTALLRNRPDFELGHVLREVPTLSDMVGQLSHHHGLSSRLDWLAQTASKLLRLQDVIIYRNEETMLRPITATRALENVPGVIVGQGPIGQVAQTGQALVSNGTASGAAVGDPTIKTLYNAPLFDDRRQTLWGVISYSSTDAQAFKQSEQLVPLATVSGIVQAIVLNDFTMMSTDQPTATAPSNGNSNEVPNSGVSQPSMSAAPEPPPAPPLNKSTRPASRGRIRLGPRQSSVELPSETGASGDVAMARLPQVEAETIEEDPMADFQRRMIGYLLKFDRDGADRVWREAYARFSAKELCTDLLQPVMIAVGEGWHRGQVSVAAEHFTTGYVEGKIMGFLNSYPDNPTGMTIVTGCAQGETHETGIMLLSLFFRWEGHKVIYLGANVPNSTLTEALQDIGPDMLCLSATMKENANNLTEVGHIISTMPDPKPIFGYGGAAFIFFPELRTRVSGVYLGDDPNSILKNVHTILNERRAVLS